MPRFTLDELAYVPAITNSAWQGLGVVYLVSSSTVYLVMVSGRMAGRRGGFGADELVKVRAVTTRIKRAK